MTIQLRLISHANRLARQGWNIFGKATLIETEDEINIRLYILIGTDPYEYEVMRLIHDTCRQHGVVVQLCNTGLFRSLEGKVAEDYAISQLKRNKIKSKQSRPSVASL